MSSDQITLSMNLVKRGKTPILTPIYPPKENFENDHEFHIWIIYAINLLRLHSGKNPSISLYIRRQQNDILSGNEETEIWKKKLEVYLNKIK